MVVIYGFVRKYVSMRRFGLLLAVVATGKLFIYDLAFLRIEGKIISYFSFGLILIGISYLYQKFKRTVDMRNVSIEE